MQASSRNWDSRVQYNFAGRPLTHQVYSKVFSAESLRVRFFKKRSKNGPDVHYIHAAKFRSQIIIIEDWLNNKVGFDIPLF